MHWPSTARSSVRLAAFHWTQEPADKNDDPGGREASPYMMRLV